VDGFIEFTGPSLHLIIRTRALCRNILERTGLRDYSEYHRKPMVRDALGSETLRRSALDLALAAISTVGVTGSDASAVATHRRQT
jgi:hypothetical protein